ncbi:hypothetical protein WMF38_13015 [Sorangium sp. So ce118]
MKKRIFALLAVIASLAIPAVARAAEPEIELVLDRELRIVATLRYPDNDPSNRFKECQTIRNGRPSGVVRLAPNGQSVELGRIRAGDDRPDADPFLVDLLAPGASVACTKVGVDPASNPIIVPVKALTVQDTKNPIQSSVAALAPGIDWFGFRGRFREAMLGALGAPTGCEIDGDKGATCSVGLIDEADGRLRLDVADATDVRRIKLFFSKNPKQEVVVILDVARCTFHATGSLPYVVAGAARQTLFLASKLPECEARLDRLTAMELSGHGPIGVASRASSQLDQGKRLELSNVPQTLSAGELTFTLKADGAAVGTALIQVLDKISAGDSPKVRVTYNVDIPDLPESFSARTNDGIAAVTPRNVGKPTDSIENEVSLQIKAPLPSMSDDVSIIQALKLWDERERLDPHGGIVSRWLWRISPVSGRLKLQACTPTAPAAAAPAATAPAAAAPAAAAPAATAPAATAPAATAPAASAPAASAPAAAASAAAASTSCALSSGPGTIAFSVSEASASPIEAKLELVEYVEVRLDAAGAYAKAALAAAAPSLLRRERTLLEATVKLASSSRVESLPLPLRDRLYVDCRGANINVANSEMRAIDDDDVVNGTCALVLLPIPVGKPGPARDLSLYQVGKSDLDRSDLVACQQGAAVVKACNEQKSNTPACQSAQKTDDSCHAAVMEESWRASIARWIDLQDRFGTMRRLNPFFGPQRLVVSVRRDGNEIATKRWDVNPGQPTWLELPHGTDTQRGSLYTVEVRVAARPTSEVVYAAATADTGSVQEGDIPQAELRFSAQLRSRGQFGFKPAIRSNDVFVGVRAYATIPVQLAGLRFPAATSELRASSDPERSQFMTPRTGLLGVIEPWNYDTGQNPWPLNLALSGGVLAIELTEPRVAISTLLGFQVKAPFLNNDSGQLTSAFALGAFWEHGVEEKENRLLVTFGANVLSLFAGN